MMLDLRVPLVGLVAYASAIPAHTKLDKCSEPIVRREWRSLASNERQDYISAINCLMNKPKEATPDWLAPAAVSRYDNFTTAHLFQTNTSHRVGHLLPWHRYCLKVYEEALRKKCDYAEALPYWDWTLDVATDEDFFKSPVFDTIDGFGGNGIYIPTHDNSTGPQLPGRTGGGCIQDGPFKDYIITLGPKADVSGNPRCLTRDLSPYWARQHVSLNRTQVTLDLPTFGEFNFDVQLSPDPIRSGLHNGGHGCIGGIMRDPSVSPVDPLFYLHHGNLDRAWWSWQKRDLEKRLLDVSGPIYAADWNNTQGGNITLDFQMTLGYVAGPEKIEDVMDIRGSILCYEYDKLYE